MMYEKRLRTRILSVCMAAAILLGGTFWHQPVYAVSEKNKESIITDVKNPSNGIIKYKVTVPPGERIDYSVQLTPDKKYKIPDVTRGSYKNRTKKTVKKTITVRVNCFSDRYKINASYTSDYRGEKLVYTDVDKAVSALKTSVTTAKFKWDSNKLGKGEKEWKYRYKFAPYKHGIKKYIEIYNKSGKRIRSYVKEIIPVSKITELIELLRAR